MINPSENHSSKSERTLLTALLLSAPGPLVTGISVILSYSTTQIADFVRRSTELAAIFVSWWVYRKMRRTHELDIAERTRLEHLANRWVGGAMTCAGSTMLMVAAARIPSYEPGGNVTMGLIIAILGLLTNTWFWVRYRALTREHFDAVIAGQQRLYRAKSLVDLCVVTALSAVAIAPFHTVTKYIDIIGSVIVAFYLLWNGIRTLRK